MAILSSKAKTIGIGVVFFLAVAVGIPFAVSTQEPEIGVASFVSNYVTLSSEQETRQITVTDPVRFRETLATGEDARHGHRMPSHPSRFVFEIKGSTPPADWVAAGTQATPQARAKTKSKKKRSRKSSRRKTARFLWPDGHWDLSLERFEEGNRRQLFFPEDEAVAEPGG